jgi:hypothetical protein
MQVLAIVLLGIWTLLSANEAASQTLIPTLTTANCAVLQNICSLDPSYNPVPNPAYGTDDPAYARPTCQNPDQTTAAERSFVWTTIGQTNGQIQKDLCKLNAIFIMKNSNNSRTIPPSYGFVELSTFHSTATNPPFQYIALNIADLNLTFSTAQNSNFAESGITNGKHSETNLSTAVVPETWGLLYVLAHELGHIKWRGTMDSNCQNAINGTWTSVTGQPRWTGFNAPFGTRDTSSFPQPATALTTSQLDAVYTGDFGSALATANYEEDFVESYALRAVGKFCNGCTFSLNTGDKTISVTDGSRGSNKLQNKFTKCGDNLF